MDAIRFRTTIGQDQTIPVPADITLPPGQAEIIVLREPLAPATPGNQDLRCMIETLANAADELGVDITDLPADLAENHDHYLHGLPKGIDNQ